MKKVLILLLAVIFSLGVFYGCKPDDVDEKVSFDQIFVSNNSITAYDTATPLFSLPEGYTLYYKGTSSKDYSSSYVSTMDAFIVRREVTAGTTKTVYYGMYDRAGKAIVPVNYTYFAVYYGYMLVGDGDGKGFLYNNKGQIVVSASNYSHIQPISADYIAVRTVSGWCNIYNKEGVAVKSNGTVIELRALITELKAVDNYLIKKKTENKIPTVSIFDLTRGKWIVAPENPFTVESSSYSLDVYYLGDGKFYFYSLNDAATESDYDFKNLSGQYCLCDIWVYDAVNQTTAEKDTDVLYSSVLNSYYAEENSAVIDINLYLKKGYSLISAALVKQEDKTTVYDQFIIDSKGKILVSMLDTLGDNVVYSASKNDYRDVLLTYLGDIGFSNTTSGNLKVYDKYGNTVLDKSDAVYSGVFVNNGIITALRTEKSGGTPYYVAYDLQGNEIVSTAARYTSMTAFVGGYAFAEYKDGSGKLKAAIVDINGVPSTPDVYAVTNSYGSTTGYFYKTGVYVFKKTETGKYGLKNYDGTVISEAAADNVVIAKYGIDKIFYTTIINNVFTVYSIT